MFLDKIGTYPASSFMLTKNIRIIALYTLISHNDWFSEHLVFGPTLTFVKTLS